MRNLATAFLLTFLICVVSASGKDLAKGSNQNPSSKSAASSQRIAGKTRQPNYNRFFRDTLWEKKLKEWEKRQSPVPKSLPRVVFKVHKQSSSRSFRSSHRSFRSSHHKTRHVRRGRSHVRIRSRR